MGDHEEIAVTVSNLRSESQTKQNLVNNKHCKVLGLREECANY